MTAQSRTPRVIVVGNEKGGAGKSTIALHVTTALLHTGARVGVIDLDLRQRSIGRFFASRRAWMDNAGVALPMPLDFTARDPALSAPGEVPPDVLEQAFEILAPADFIIIDTPGGDTGLSRAAHARADLIVTPMNDSFVDFDMLGTVDPVTLDLIKPGLYSETVWEARKQRMMADRSSVDWVVLRNRLAPAEARNRRRLDERVAALSRRIGFRIGPGLRDRVIYRELFPFGLTVADLSTKVRPVAVSLSHVAARQELRGLMQSLGLPQGASAAVEPEPLAAAS
ncbi:MAG TPA: division plane positioning ATPase MipZ [Caulobacteraceae bacterium]|nr:division plane positioning ATPase MipZ [Caulobacteraceae bacterium]